MQVYNKEKRGKEMRLRKIAYALFIIATICLFTSCKKECKHQSIEWVIDKQATCTEEGIEHEECTKCHEKFDIKEIKKLKHICNDEGICTICGNKVATSGLIYKLNEDKKSYYVSEYIGIDIDIIIPAKYDGLYVTSIGDSAFSGCTSLTIYCEALKEPSGWANNWNPSNCKVVWGYKKSN